MRALYWRRPTAAELDPDIGLKPGDYDADEPRVDLWPENWPVIDLYYRNRSQWRVGFGGLVGLDYTVFFHELDRKGLAPDDYDEMMDALRIVEETALDELSK